MVSIMKTITAYQTEDEQLWISQENGLKHEAILQLTKVIGNRAYVENIVERRTEVIAILQKIDPVEDKSESPLARCENCHNNFYRDTMLRMKGKDAFYCDDCLSRLNRAQHNNA